jgi:hypothetical protein
MNDTPHRHEDEEDPPQYGMFFFFSLSACFSSAMASNVARVLAMILSDDRW